MTQWENDGKKSFDGQQKYGQICDIKGQIPQILADEAGKIIYLTGFECSFNSQFDQ
jgi:hypothetical protein